MRFIISMFAIIYLCIHTSYAYAELKFTEVYPAPEKNNIEWVEVLNDSESAVNTYGYSISDLTGNNFTIESTLLSPHEYAIATSSSVINNSGDTLFLKNVAGAVVHTVTTPKDISSHQSFILCGSDWKITNIITQKFSNNPACNEPSPTSATPTASPQPTSIKPSIIENIYLSEALVFPEKDEYEWVELYNNGDQSVDLVNWYIDDNPQGSSPYKFTITINKHDFAIIPLPTSMFNNSGDEIRLLSSEGEVVDKMEYAESELGFSLTRTSFSSDQSCISEVTRRSKNSPCFIHGEDITIMPGELTHNKAEIAPLIPLISPRMSNFEQKKSSLILFGLAIPTPHIKPTPAIVGKTYSLVKIPEHSNMHKIRIGLLCTLLTCAIHFVYSIYKYKNICVSLFTIGSQHLPG